VNHCPYCHGFEFAGQSLGVLHTTDLSEHQVRIIQEWGPTTYFLNGHHLEAPMAAELQSLGITLVSERVAGIAGEGTQIDGIQLEDGRIVPIDALYIGPTYRLNSKIPDQLGCAIDAGPLGPIVRVDEIRATTVPGVFAAGDIVRAMHAITLATADGMMAGTAVHRSLIMGT
jgi:thioredoxin reductase